MNVKYMRALFFTFSCIISGVLLSETAIAQTQVQSNTALIAIQGLSSFGMLRNSSLGVNALNANYLVTGDIQNGLSSIPFLRPFSQQQQQALRDATITDANGYQLADGFGTKLGGAYQSLTTFTSPDNGYTVSWTGISTNVNNLIAYTYGNGYTTPGLNGYNSEASKYFYGNGTDFRNPLSGAELNLYNTLTSNGFLTNVYGLTYGAGTPPDPLGNPRPFQTLPGFTSFNGNNFFGNPSGNNPYYLYGPTQNLTSSPSFPSGHTTCGVTETLLFAIMIPERFQQLVTRGVEYGTDRIVMGAHYTTDIIGGRTLAYYNVAQLMANNSNYLGTVNNVTINDFQSALSNAQSDLRNALESATGSSIAVAATQDTSRFQNITSDKNFYQSTLSYGLPVVWTNNTAPVNFRTGSAELSNAGYLLRTRFPYLTVNQCADIISSTQYMPAAGGFLDNGSSFGYYSRIDLFTAAGGYGAFNDFTGDVSITMNAARGGFNAVDTWSNDIGGSKGFTLNGTGKLIFSGRNTYAGPTVINGGTLEVTGSILSSSFIKVNRGGSLANLGTIVTPMLSVGPGGGCSMIDGTLDGNLNIASGGYFSMNPSVINGNVNNSGTMVVNNTNTINGNLVQNRNGTLLIHVGNGLNSMLSVKGAATLGGTLVIAPATGTVFGYGQKITFLSATDITGSFSSVVTPAGFRGRVKVVGDPQLEVLMAPASYTQMAVNCNQSNVATALNSFIPATSGDQLVVSTTLDSLTAGQYNQAFNAIMPTFYQQVATIAFNQANAQNMELNQRLWGLRIAEGGGFSMSGLADNYAMIQEGEGDDSGKGVLDSKKDILRPGLDNHWGMFVDGNGIFAQANSANMLPGYNSESGGVTAGLSYQWTKGVATGIYAGYEGSYTKSGANGSGLGTGSSLTDNAVRFGVFGTYGQENGKGFYANALAGGAYHNLQATRVIQYPGLNRTANSTPGAGELDTMLSTGYDVQKGKFTFGPTASLQYTYLGVNSVNETGAQSLDFNSSGWNSSSMLSSLGAHAAYNWQVRKDILVVPQVSLNWQHEFLQNPYAINGNLGGTSPTFSNRSATPIRDFLYTGVGFTVDFAKRWNTSFFYNAAAGNQNLVSQNIFWSAGLKF